VNKQCLQQWSRLLSYTVVRAASKRRKL